MAIAPTPHRHAVVPRADADHYLRLMLVSFAGCVIAVRAYLALTGYPQIGNGTLHIAHALWGGLLLFAASLLPLLFTDSRAYTWAAVLSGLGAGLFIDEVGKFITRENDYFFPAAAPIAYGVFLLSVLVYVRATGSRPKDARGELHNALEDIKDALDGRLRPGRSATLKRRLRRAIELAEQPELHRLACGLLDVHERISPSPAAHPGALTRLRRRLGKLASRWLTELPLRVAIVIGLGALGLLAVSDLAIIVSVAIDAVDGSESHTTQILNRYAHIRVNTTAGIVLFLIRAALDVVVGGVLLYAAILMVRGMRARALNLAYVSLLVSLTVINLLVFYFEQFIAAAGAIAEFSVLQTVRRYQAGYLPDKGPD